MTTQPLQAAPSGGLGIVYKALAGAIVPVTFMMIGWGVKLEVHNAVTDQRLAEAEKEIEEQAGSYGEISKGVQSNASTLVRLEAELKSANDNLSEIKTILRGR